uniref:Disease resistance N-terminal domain-containing protein n=1 Tax=Opuntia streptacantha TaxID=393608 RepID=A0A7C9EP52_OPUST
MAEGVLFNLAEDILKHLGSRALAEIASAWGFKGQLKKLTDTINTIKDVLLDAEEKQQHNSAIRRWLEGLKEVVYAADDLFDEFATKASQKEVMGGSKFTKEEKSSCFDRKEDFTSDFKKD